MGIFDSLFPAYKPTAVQTWLSGGPSPEDQFKAAAQQLYNQKTAPVATKAPVTYGGAATTKTNAVTPVTTQNISIPSVDAGPAPSMPSFEEVYAPLYAALSGQEAQAKSDLTDVQGSLEKQRTNETEQLNQAKDEQQTALNKQETGINSDQQNAQAQARQIYNELSQYNQSRFGGAGSTGQAMMELLGRETQKQFGNITDTASKAKADIADKTYQLNRYSTLQAQKINDAVDDKLMEATRQYNSQIMNISSQRGQIDSVKSGAYMQAAQAYQERVSSLQQWKLQTVINLAVWNSQQQAAMQNTLAGTPQALTSAQYLGYAQPIVNAPSSVQAMKPTEAIGYSVPQVQNGYNVQPKDWLAYQTNPFSQIGTGSADTSTEGTFGHMS